MTRFRDPAALADCVSQFLLSRDETVAAPGWTVREVGPWKLSHHEALAWTEVVARDGGNLGWFLGTILDPDGTAPTGRVEAPLPAAAGADPDAVEDFVFRYGGRWLFFDLDTDAPSVLMDPIGTLALVYDTRAPRAAATTTLLDPEAGFGKEHLGIDVPFPIPNHYYPGELTGSVGVKRLMADYRLDLNTMTAVRHWPRENVRRVATREETEACIRTIVDGVQSVMRALAERGELLLSLTAGRDSRMLLACCRELADRITCFTFDFPTLTGPVDLAVARLLCRDMGLEHVTVPIVDVDEATQRRYLERIGFAGHPGKAWDFLVAAGTHLDTSKSWAIAYSSEVGRGNYWKPRDRADVRPDAVDLLARGGLPPLPSFVRAMDDWIDSLDYCDTFVILDILALEHRGCGWAMAHLHGAAPFRDIIVPYSRRDILDAMMRLPLGLRKEQGMPREVIRATWPELLRYPFQRTPGAAGRWREIRDMTLRPRVLKVMDRLNAARQDSRVIDAAYVGARNVYRKLRQ